MIRTLPPRVVPELPQEIPRWLDQWRFTRFVTLAFNDPMSADARLPGSQLKFGFLRERLRRWDARMNHALLGKHWAERDADRAFAFYTLEKANVNPHWHGLVRFFQVSGMTIADQESIFDERAEPAWKKLVRSGTVDVQPITLQQGVANYVAKTLGYELSYEHYVVPDEFNRG
jgi:hypothetical protein